MELAKEIVLMTKEVVTILSMVFTTFFAFKTYQNNMKKASRKKNPRSDVSSIAADNICNR